MLQHNDIKVNIQDHKGNTDLHYASCYSPVEYINILLAHVDINVNVQDKTGKVPLHYATRSLCAKLLLPLLSPEHIEINMEDTEGKTPFHSSIENDKVTAIKQLLSHKDIDVNATDKYGRTPLRMAVEYCYRGCIEALLRHKDINVDLKDEQGRTSLEIAQLLTSVTSDQKYFKYRQQYEYIVALLEGFVFSDHQSRINSTTVNSLTEADSTEFDEMPVNLPLIHQVVKNRDNDMLRIILDNNLINSNARDVDERTPLHISTLTQSLKCTKLLLSSKDIHVNAHDD